MGTKYTSTADSPSGYGSAARAFITALHSVGVDVTCEMLYQMPEKTNYGWTGELSNHLKNRDIPYKIKIIHLTPDTYSRYMEKDKYHIGHLFWETDRLPQEWIEPCNKMGEIWTSSSAMAELFKASGVKVPIYYFPQPLDITMADKPYGKYEIDNHKGYMFYSIFQWIERKNPKGLLRAYWKAMKDRDDVTLLLKTYRINYTESDTQKILAEINQWKRELGQSHYPKVMIVPRLLQHDDLMRLHKTADCYITADHGEGWNRVVQEALLMGKPVISTARGGIHEYLNEELYFPIPSKYVPVVEQSWIKFYRSDQNWAEPDEEELIKTIRWVFANRAIAQAKGVKAKDYIKDEFSYFRIGTQMKVRLEQIDKKL